MKTGYLIVAGVSIGFLIDWLIRWIRSATPQADPWGREVEEELEATSAVPLCLKCLEPQRQESWFCPECGHGVGPYNNLSPYLYIFSLGEAFRNGVADETRVTRFVLLGYFMISFAQFGLLAPVYWFFLLKNSEHVEKPETSAPSV